MVAASNMNMNVSWEKWKREKKRNYFRPKSSEKIQAYIFERVSVVVLCIETNSPDVMLIVSFLLAVQKPSRVVHAESPAVQLL